ncbi:hypothetical protein J1N35_022818 [Gossypium stocksii]|uniref:Uncharacterized protein n=1 Tax=Gossypium stocksii TaxID=47602 RepID=A0A9D3VIG2_9ROSI|nr:hypothetical protein J1N35_022818 [Gossypium stocksii]
MNFSCRNVFAIFMTHVERLYLERDLARTVASFVSHLLFMLVTSKKRKFSSNSRNAKGEEIESNALPQTSSPSPTASLEALEAEVGEALLEMMGLFMGQWFD